MAKEKRQGQVGTQSGKVEDIFARIEKLDKRFPRRFDAIPNDALRNERKKLDALQRKALGLPPLKTRAEKEKLKLLNKKIDNLKARMGLQKGKTGTQSGKAEDTKVRLEKLKKKYPIASKVNEGFTSMFSSTRDYQKEKDKLSRIKKRQDKEAEVRSDNRKADSVAARIAGYRDDLTKEERRNKKAKIKSDLQDSYARIRGESKAQSGGMKAGGKVKKMRAGGPVGNGKKKADGIALRGKTRCKIR